MMRRGLSAMGVLLALAAGGVQAQGRLLISELLYHPRAGEAEYVELYNPSAVAVELADYHVVRWIGDSLGRHYALPAYTVEPHGSVVLTGNAASVMANYEVRYPSRLVECSLPPFPNGGGSVILATADSLVVERLDYDGTTQGALLRNAAGISLERRSFSRPASSADNWRPASSVAGYGTPGYENSQALGSQSAGAVFAFSATTLSPNGDGHNDVLEIDYQLAEGADLSARAEVYNREGQLVVRLLNGDLLGQHGTFGWDGRDGAGHLLPAGQYIVSIVLFDLRGTVQTVRRVVALL